MSARQVFYLAIRLVPIELAGEKACQSQPVHQHPLSERLNPVYFLSRFFY
ncbi:hypothetical protein [Vampirovibrio chlorellavorus]|nr:hypothetical protein [Vampirovibrio chlorellavorus]